MKGEGNRAQRGIRFGFPLSGGLFGRLKGRAQGFFTDLSERGETRLEEMSRNIRQSDPWLKAMALRERAERAGSGIVSRFEGMTEKTLGKVGIATDTQVMELAEQIRRLRWQLDRLQKETPLKGEGSGDPQRSDAEIRSLA